jgi:hypothetical protein
MKGKMVHHIVSIIILISTFVLVRTCVLTNTYIRA